MTALDSCVLLLLMLLTKHLYFDWMNQPPYQLTNKGTYGHPGGIIHATWHVLGSMVAFFTAIGLDIIPMALWPLVGFLVAEFLIHYHMDWFKMWWGKRNRYVPVGSDGDKCRRFWAWTGIDQHIHILTYIGMAYLYVLVVTS